MDCKLYGWESTFLALRENLIWFSPGSDSARKLQNLADLKNGPH